MNKARPAIEEPLEILQQRLRQERNPLRKPRIHMLVLFQSGQARSRKQAAEHLAVHRNTIGQWLQRYQDQGLEGLLALKKRGAPAQQRTLPPRVMEALKARLATKEGFASYADVCSWLKDEFNLSVPYKTVHGLLYYRLKAKLKVPRPVHEKKVSLPVSPSVNTSSVDSPAW